MHPLEFVGQPPAAPKVHVSIEDTTMRGGLGVTEGVGLAEGVAVGDAEGVAVNVAEGVAVSVGLTVCVPVGEGVAEAEMVED